MIWRLFESWRKRGRVEGWSRYGKEGEREGREDEAKVSLPSSFKKLEAH